MHNRPHNLTALSLLSQFSLCTAIGLTGGCLVPPGSVEGEDFEAEDLGNGDEAADFADGLGSSDDGDAGEPPDGGTGDPGIDTNDSGSCEPVERQFSPNEASVMLLVDKSGSMMGAWEGAEAVESRWSSMHAAVSDVAVAFEDTLDLGLQLFPRADAGSNDGACEVADQVEVSVGSDNASNILAALPARDATVFGASPTTAAVDLALDHLLNQSDDRRKAMILVTDGGASCVGPHMYNYDDRLNTIVGDAYRNDHIPTYVVGLGIVDEFLGGPDGEGSNVWEKLNDLAEQGGVPTSHPHERFYNVHDGTALTEKLQFVARQEACVFNLDGDLPPTDLWISVDDTDFDFISDCENEDGWVWADTTATFGSIKLCGSACDQFLDHGEVTVTYTCQ